MEKIERWEITEIRFKNRYGKMITRPIEGSYEKPTLDLAMGNEHFNSLNDIPHFNVIAPYLTEFSILSPISGKIDLSIFKNIHRLSFHSSHCEIEGIETLKHLRYLDLSYMQSKKIGGLHTLKKLRHLNLSYANISKIPYLGVLNKLERLDLSHNQISKIEGFDGLKNLREMNLSDNNISKIEGFDAFKDIYGVYLSNNNISKIENLTKMQTLQKIRLDSNPISKIEGLDGMKKLNSVSLSNTKIKSIEGITSLSDLYSIDVTNTAVSSLEPLKKYKRISYIRAKNCPIRSLHGITTDPNHLYKLYIDPKNLCPLGAQLFLKLYRSTFSFLPKNNYSLLENKEIDNRNELSPLLEFYRRSTTDLALQHCDRNSTRPLTPQETERLIHEATQKERLILENAADDKILPYDDPILSQITARFSVGISEKKKNLRILL